MDRDNNFVTCMGLLLSTVLVALFAAVVNGWALSTVWNWFIPPLFHLTTLTLAQAIGVSFVLSIFVGTKGKNNESTKGKTFAEIVLTSVIESAVAAVFYVTFGWIVFQFAF